MKRVNQHWLKYIWGHISEGNKTERIARLDMSNPENVKILVDDFVKKSWSHYPLEVQRQLKDTWQYALNKLSDDHFEWALDELLPPFDIPSDVRSLYEKVWELMFPDEDWHQAENEFILDIDDSLSTPWDSI